MKTSIPRLSAIFSFCGVCIAFYIGAGFATMQELMQYEASYGSQFFVVILVAAAIYIYTNISFATNGNRLKLTCGGDIYAHYCGKHIGRFYNYFSALFCYVCFIVMCGGANSTVAEQWGLPNGVGAILLTIAVVVTTMLGLNGILRALGKIGPINIAIILFISIFTFISGFEVFGANIQAIDSGAYHLTQVGGGSPLFSGASYGGFVILWFATFWSEIGGKNRLKEVNVGMLLSAVFIFGTAALCCAALISHIDITAYADIPALSLANSIHPLLGQAFAIIILCGTYAASVPLLWTGVSRVAKEGSLRYRVLAMVGGIIGCITACFLPYKGLVNILYGMNGYLGFILVIFMLVHDIWTLVGKGTELTSR